MAEPVGGQRRSGALLKSILTVATGSALGSVIGFAAAPALTRLFSPTEFGAFSVATAVAMVLLSLVTGRMELTVPLPKADAEGRNLLFVGAGIAAVTIFVLTLVALLAPNFASNLTPDALNGSLIAVPILLVPVASFTLLNAWAIRQSRYRAIATRNVVHASVTALAQLGFGLVGFGVAGLIGGYCIGQTVGALSLLHRSGLVAAGSVSKEELLAGVRRYRRYLLVLAPSGFINALGGQAPVLLIASTYGVSAAGLVALTQRVLAVPMTLLGLSTAQVYLSELARSVRSGGTEQLLTLFWRTTRLLGTMAVAIVLVGSPVSYVSFGPIFGPQWVEAGPLAALLIFGIGAQLVGSSVSQTLIVFERLGLVVLWDIGRLLSMIGVLSIAWCANWTLVQAVALLSATTAILYILYWWLSYRTLLRFVEGTDAA